MKKSHHAVLFVIDSAPQLHPSEEDVFSIAKEGIVQFLESSSLPVNGEWAIGVTQYISTDSVGIVEGLRGYEGTYHWFRPLTLVGSGDRDELITLVSGLSRNRHSLASFMEIGLREACMLLTSNAKTDASSDMRVILLSSGEFRVPRPCPPLWFETSLHEETPTIDNYPNGSCLAAESDGVVPACSRSCQIRYFANAARKSGIEISTILIPKTLHASHISSDRRDPYEGYAAWCERRAPDERRDIWMEAPTWPDREGLLAELANWSGREREQKCNSYQPIGRYSIIALNSDESETSNATQQEVVASKIGEILEEWFEQWDHKVQEHVTILGQLDSNHHQSKH